MSECPHGVPEMGCFTCQQAAEVVRLRADVAEWKQAAETEASLRRAAVDAAREGTDLHMARGDFIRACCCDAPHAAPCCNLTDDASDPPVLCKLGTCQVCLQAKVDGLANLLHAEGVCEVHGRTLVGECTGCCAAAAAGKDDEIARLRAEIRERDKLIAEAVEERESALAERNFARQDEEEWRAEVERMTKERDKYRDGILTADRIRAEAALTERDAAVQRADAAEKERDEARAESEMVLAGLEEIKSHYLGGLLRGEVPAMPICGWCGAPMKDTPAFRAHALECPASPPVLRAVAAERERDEWKAAVEVANRISQEHDAARERAEAALRRIVILWGSYQRPRGEPAHVLFAEFNDAVESARAALAPDAAKGDEWDE